MVLSTILDEPGFSLSSSILLVALLSLPAYLASHIVYNIWLHPLSKYPGPLYMRASRLGYVWRAFRGTLPFDMLDLHARYGDVVRISPNELAFATPCAWQDIHGHRTKGQPEFTKWQPFYRPVEEMETDIVSAGREEHSMLRRTLAHGFSDKGLREQQPLINKYIDLLIQRLHENCRTAQPLDISQWYSWTTFDVIGDLAFGEPFGCLETSSHHFWVQLIFRMSRAGVILQGLGAYPTFQRLVLNFIPRSVMQDAIKHDEIAMDKLHRRMLRGQQRPDLINGLLMRRDHTGQMAISDGKLAANAGKLILAGSDTTSTLLAGVTYFLMRDRAVLKRVTEEVRSAFESEDDINFTSVGELSYMLACLNEALRCYPPAAPGLPRLVPEGGAMISGVYVPGGSVVSIHPWAMNHSAKFWKQPHEFRPERFLGAQEFAGDVREAFQPFLLGPRNCIGRNLAYVEMRTILARVLYNFDLRMSEESRGWLINQRNYNLWDKPPLYAHLTPRRSWVK